MVLVENKFLQKSATKITNSVRYCLKIISRSGVNKDCIIIIWQALIVLAGNFGFLHFFEKKMIKNAFKVFYCIPSLAVSCLNQ